jgi:4-hydroxy-2-oxoheptanedioate aldolase
MLSPINPVRQALKSRSVVIGAAVTIDSLMAVEALATVGFDFLFFDLEHGVISIEKLHDYTAMLKGSSVVPIVRLASDEPWQIKRALDTGVKGIVVPFVNHDLQAREVVRSCKYPPEGVRGLGCMLAASRWGMTSQDYFEAANREIIVGVQVETARAVEDAPAIAGVPGVDMLFLGPADLSADLGTPFDTESPNVVACIEQVAAAGCAAGVGLGTVAKTSEEIRTRIDQGFTFLVVGGDLSGLKKSAVQACGMARRAAEALAQR